MAKKKAKRKVPAVPKTLAEAARTLLRIGELQREIRGVNDGVSEAIEELKREAMDRVSPLTRERDECLAGIWAYAEGNKDDVTDHGKRRSVEVPSGNFGWRTHPPAVGISNAEKVLAELKRLGLERFIRTSEEPNKKAMLEEPEVAKAVKGVRIKQDETFFVKPSATDVEIEESLSSLEAEWEQ